MSLGLQRDMGPDEVLHREERHQRLDPQGIRLPLQPDYGQETEAMADHRSHR